ncbi:sugar-binding transcriptional regulator [Mesorhizobium sp. 8]|nr:sugar-binding transcriptional regulator [Mesorhizobium sp. 8]
MDQRLRMASIKAASRDGREVDARLPTEFADAVTWSAWLYYADGMTQSEIAKRLQVSRATIVNYLQEARDRGIVSVHISPQASGRTAIARDLMSRFGLHGVFVIPNGEEQSLVRRLGDAGARVLADQIEDGDTIGVAWGRTVLAVAEQIVLRKPVRNVTVVQVSGSSTGEPEFSPELCTSVLSNRIHARCVNLLAPAVLSTRGLKAMLLDEPVLKKQFELIHSTNRILFGVGDIGPGSTVRGSGIASGAEMDAYVRQGAVAVIIGRFIDSQGRPIGGDHDERMVGISLDELKQVESRICVAGGPVKIAAIMATLEAGYATHFVTDVATGEALLAG